MGKQESPSVMICPERKNSWKGQLEIESHNKLAMKLFGNTKLASKSNRILKQTLKNLKRKKSVNKKQKCKKRKCSRNNKSKSKKSKKNKKSKGKKRKQNVSKGKSKKK